MQTLVPWTLAALAGLMAIPIAVLCLEVVAAVLSPRAEAPTGAGQVQRMRVAVLVPAHDESTHIVDTLGDIKPQLRAGDRLLVVADNCTDDTAAIARSVGAEVAERNDLQRIGKGYALDWGLRALDRDPPDVVIMIDADCRVGKDAINRLAGACATTGRPAQALDLMTAPEGSRIGLQIAEFAWRVKNWVRPLGLRALNLPCQLVGTGMAFPWKVIRAAELASGWIVEDIKLGLDLAAAGHQPLFCPSARVTSHFASSAVGADTQRRRWEQGHIATILTVAPRMLALAVARRDLGLLALALDLAVPPLSLFALLLALISAAAGLSAVAGLGTAALIISTTCVLAFAISILLAWSKCGRDVLPPRAILSIPGYVLGKLGFYAQILGGRKNAQWIRTDRTGP